MSGVRRRAVLAGASALALACTRRTGGLLKDPDTGTEAISARVAAHLRARWPAHQLPRRWGGAIAALGLARLDAAAPEARPHRNYLRAYHRANWDLQVDRPDHCAVALSGVGLGEESSPTVARVAEFLRREPRNRLGALDHLGQRSALGRLYPPSIWIDSLVVYGLTAAVVGDALNDRALEDFGLSQAPIFARWLQDPATGLFRHAYLHTQGRWRPQAPVFWLRGNGWAALALVDMLERMSAGDPRRARVRSALVRLGSALATTQRFDGRWGTLVGRADTRAETSGSCLAAYALAKGSRLGFLPSAGTDAAAKTLCTVEAALAPRRRGLTVTDVSGPTIPGPAAAYRTVPHRAGHLHGIGAYCILAAELLHSTR